MQLTPEQKLIITHDGAQIVIAGAGTGKTETLTQHILHLLLEKRYDLHAIVAITFTEKAAAEMRERIYGALSARRDQTADAEERDYIDSIRKKFSMQNRISTIDAFNASLLSAYHECSPLPMDYQIIDKYTEYLLIDQTQRLFLRELEKNELLWDMFSALHEQIDLNSLFNNIAYLARRSDDELEDLQREITREEYIEKIRKLCDLHLDALWREYVSTVPSNINSKLYVDLTNSDKVPDLLTQKGYPNKTKFKRNPQLAEISTNWPISTATKYKDWVGERDAQKKHDSYDDEWESHQVLRQLAQIACFYKKKEREIILETGKVRFSDVAEAALAMLRQNPHVLQEVRQGIQHILVDEFQDTSYEQWELIELLRSPDNLMLVGDPKQSIYRFRGGDVTVFERVRKAEFTPEQQRELTVSHRAHPGLIRFYNEAFAQILSTAEERPVYVAAHQDLGISDAKQNSDLPNGITWIDSATEDEDKNDRRGIAALAAFLRCLQNDARAIAEGGKVLLPSYAEIAKKIANGEKSVVGVLCSTHKYKTACESALRKHGVQFTSYQGRGFYDSMPVLFAINLSRFFCDEQNNLALVGLLRSPLCGVSDVVLTKLALINPSFWNALEEAGESSLFSEEELKLLNIVHEQLRSWRDAARVLSFCDVLETVWQQSWLPFYFGLDDEGVQEQENFAKLMDILRTAQRQNEYGLSQTAAFLEVLRNENAEEAQADLPDDGSVQLMTIYAAKGLGFDMTILVEMDQQAKSGRSSIRMGELGEPSQKYFSVNITDEDSPSKNTRLWNVLKQHERMQADAELRRKLYVACTRAKQHLVLIPKSSNKEGWFSWLDPMRTAAKLHEFTLADLQDMMGDLLPEAAVDESSRIPVLEPALQGSALPAQVSVTQLLDLVYPGSAIDDEEEESLGEVLPARTDSHAKLRGSIMHRLLEWENKSTFTAVQNLAAQEGLSVKDAQQLSALSDLALQTLGGLPLVHDEAVHEMAFTLSHHDLRKLLERTTCDDTLRDWLNETRETFWCNGIIDYLAPLQGGAYALVDFKTHWNSAIETSEATRHRIGLQLQLYAMAAQKMGLAVQRLYALRIYGVEGKAIVEEYECMDM